MPTQPAKSKSSGQSTAGTTRRKKAAKRELIDTGNEKRYVRRDAAGRFDEVDDVGQSLAQDRRRMTKTVSKPGQRRPPEITTGTHRNAWERAYSFGVNTP